MHRKERRAEAKKLRAVAIKDHGRVIAELEHRNRVLQDAVRDLTGQCKQFLIVTTLLMEKEIISHDEITEKEQAILERLTGNSKKDSVQPEEGQTVG